jgi:mono/diheme cytochrome c family protein
MSGPRVALAPALALAMAVLLCLAACDRSERDMLRQPRLGPGAASPLFGDGKAARTPPPGTVVHAMGDAATVSSGRNGAREPEARDEANAQQRLPQRPSQALLLRGQERYTIYCLPCHSAVGDGDGPVVRRGFPAPPSFHAPRLRQADDRHFFDVIGRGYGAMYPFADRITPEDRWAVVAYVRALQLSRHARVADLPVDLRERVAAVGTAPTPAPSANDEWRVAPAAEGTPR